MKVQSMPKSKLKVGKKILNSEKMFRILTVLVLCVLIGYTNAQSDPNELILREGKCPTIHQNQSNFKNNSKS